MSPDFDTGIVMRRENELTAIELIRAEIEKCVGCGNCLYSCPVYAEQGDEDYVARGRNRLLKQGLDAARDLTPEVAERFSKCLLCGRCTMVCPQAVRNDLIVMAVRRALVREKGLPVTKSIAFRRMLKNRATMRRALKVAKAMERLLPSSGLQQGPYKHMPLEEGGRIRHLPLFLAGLGGGRHLPALAEKSLSEQMGEHHPPSGRTKARNLKVAYFAGCATEFCMPSTGKALIELLNHMGVEVFFPHAQGCCGIAVYANGDTQTAAAMAAHNLAVLEAIDADFIVTGCATCGSALKDGWIQIAPGREEKERFRRLAAKVRDVSELLVLLGDYQPLRYSSRLPPGTRVTYHDPCHLARHQGVSEPPRAILRQVFGHHFVEMHNRGCCGCGGSFNVSHYRLSRQIAQDKIDAVARTGADVVINTCPGCMLQLIDNIERGGLKQKVVHLVEAVGPPAED